MKFVKHLSLYTAVGVISAGINFFIMPLLSHYLSPGDYGTLALFNTYVTILLPIVSISATSLLSVEYFRQKSRKVFSDQFVSIQLIPLINTLILAILVSIFYGNIADELELTGTSTIWGFVILVVALLAIYYDQVVQFLILQKKARLYAYYSLLRVGVEVALTFYFIVLEGSNWEGRMYSWLISSFVFTIIGFFYFKKQGLLDGKVRIQYIREGIRFGAPLVLHGIGKFVVNQSDRLFIVKMVSLEEAGIYNIGYTVGSLVMIVVNGFFGFYSPFLMENLSDLNENRKLQIVKMNYYYISGTLFLLLLILLLTPLFFKYFIDHRYINGVKYVFWVALGYCFWGAYMLFSGIIFYLKKSNILGWLSIFNVATNLILNYYFIKLFGAIGAAYATAVSFFMLMALVAWIAHKLLPLPWLNFSKLKSVRLS